MGRSKIRKILFAFIPDLTRSMIRKGNNTVPRRFQSRSSDEDRSEYSEEDIEVDEDVYEEPSNGNIFTWIGQEIKYYWLMTIYTLKLYSMLFLRQFTHGITVWTLQVSMIQVSMIQVLINHWYCTVLFKCSYSIN